MTHVASGGNKNNIIPSLQQLPAPEVSPADGSNTESAVLASLEPQMAAALRRVPEAYDVKVTLPTAEEVRERRSADAPFIGGLAVGSVLTMAGALLPEGAAKNIALAAGGSGFALAGAKVSIARWRALRARRGQEPS